MRKLRNFVIAGVLTCATLSGGISVLAANAYDLKVAGADITLHGFIEFVEGPLWVKDKVYYNGALRGRDASLIVDGSNSGCETYVHLCQNQMLVVEVVVPVVN